MFQKDDIKALRNFFLSICEVSLKIITLFVLLILMPDLKFSFAIFLYRALNCVLNKLMRVDPSGFEYHSYMEILNNSFKNKFK